MVIFNIHIMISLVITKVIQLELLMNIKFNNILMIMIRELMILIVVTIV